MLENTGSERSQGNCANCGAEIRPGTAFCISCGAPLTPEPEEPGPTNPEQNPSEEQSPFDSLLVQLRGTVIRLREFISGSATDNLRRLPGRALSWFRDLPGAPKLVLVGVTVLVLLVLLSLVALLAAALLFGVSLIALVIRMSQGGSLKGWSMVAVASLVSVFVFGGISGALYGTSFVGSSAPDTGDANEAVREGPGEGADDGPAYTVPPEGEAQGSTVYGSIDPELEEIIDAWRSSDTESPLFLPTYLPFPVAEVEADPHGAGQQEYYLWSDNTIEISNYIRIVLLGPASTPSSYFAQDTITIDGRDYPYRLDEQPSPGNYVVLLWVDTERGEEYMYQVDMNTAVLGPPLPPEEFAEVVSSMERIDPSDV